MENLHEHRVNNVGDFDRRVNQSNGRLMGFAVAAALPLMVFLRHKIGKRRLGYGSIALALAMMMLASWVGNVHIGFSLFSGVGFQHGRDTSLDWFAFAFLGVAGVGHRRRVKEAKRGAPEALTFSHGETRWPWLPVPREFIGFVDPPLACLIGAVVYYELHLFVGLWWMLASVAFLVVECAVYRRSEQVFDDGIDAYLLARLQSGLMGRLAEKKESAGSKDTESGGDAIFTGVDDLLQREIEKRQGGNNQNIDGGYLS